VFIRREDPERFLEEVRGDDPEHLADAHAERSPAALSSSRPSPPPTTP
jgi:hypothetical protein